jgi:hypothetical protein
MDRFYPQNKSRKEKQRLIFENSPKKQSALILITVLFGLFSSLCFFIAEMSANIVLYDFNFIPCKYKNFLIYTFSLISSFLYSASMTSRVIWNVSKISPEVFKEEQNDIDEFFIALQKISWFLGPINFGCLLYQSFSWYGFIVGAILKIIDLCDNIIFLQSCDKKVNTDFNKYYQSYFFCGSYLLGLSFTITYSFATVYLTLVYFANQFFGTSATFNVIFSLSTATCGAVSGIIYRYRTFRKLKAKHMPDRENKVDNKPYVVIPLEKGI